MAAGDHPLASPGPQGGDEHDDGEADSQSGEGHISLRSHMADIDPVHNVIQGIDDLGHNRRQGQPYHQWPQAVLAQVVGMRACQWNHS